VHFHGWVIGSRPCCPLVMGSRLTGKRNRRDTNAECRQNQLTVPLASLYSRVVMHIRLSLYA
jgi:hypothetical protein